ncbi:MAG: hypothetical protein H7X95_01820 [Deltaproteobacteria bacterium]|nr:hypothetical protein [Deltaproteobacteria bacterium]
MSVEIERATLPCGVCGAQVSELRRGRCWGCYTRWSESRPVGKGAACVICQERRRSELRLVELQMKSRALCHSCAGRIARMESVPTSINAIRVILERERRGRDRRDDGADRRIFPRERRVGERRAPPRTGGNSDTDPHILLPDFEEIVIELVEADLESVEQTQVRERTSPPAPPAEA